MNAKKLHQSRKKKGQYERQFHKTAKNKASRKARIERRKKQCPQDPKNIFTVKRARSFKRMKMKAYRLALIEAEKQERARKAA